MPTRSDRKLTADLRLLTKFVQIYCADHHAAEPRSPVALPTCDVTALAGREVCLCRPCSQLLMHALVKRSHCPMDPKPACKHCPQHCYAAPYRQQMRTVMAWSGRKLVLRGRLDYLLKLWS
jgi:hypothetical protein